MTFLFSGVNCLARSAAKRLLTRGTDASVRFNKVWVAGHPFIIKSSSQRWLTNPNAERRARTRSPNGLLFVMEPFANGTGHAALVMDSANGIEAILNETGDNPTQYEDHGTQFYLTDEDLAAE